MKWNKYRMKTTTEAVDLISYTLGEMGIEGIEIEDKIPLSDEDKKKMFIDILPDLGEDDGVAYVSFYIEPEKDHAETPPDIAERKFQDRPISLPHVAKCLKILSNEIRLLPIVISGNVVRLPYK